MGLGGFELKKIKRFLSEEEKMKKLTVWLTLLLVVALVASASAIDQKGKFAIGGYGGYSFGFGDVFKEYELFGVKYQSKVTFSFGAKAKYGVTNNLALVGAFDYQGTKSEAEGTFEFMGESYPVSESVSSHWLGILANGVYTLSPEKKTCPYLTGGVGFYIPDEGDSKPGINLGGGVEHFFKPNLALDAGARFHMIFTEDKSTTYAQILVGLTYYLGTQ